jgi:hypothetical protein
MNDSEKFWQCALSFFRSRHEGRHPFKTGKKKDSLLPNHKRNCQMVRYFIAKIHQLEPLK